MKVFIPDNQRHWVVVGVIIVLGVLLYYFYIIPNSHKIQDWQQKIVTAKKEYDELKAVADTYEPLTEEYNALLREIEIAKQQLPGEKQVSDLLRNIELLAHYAGVKLQRFEPGALTAKGFYSELVINIGLQGTYHQLGYFLDYISNLPRIVNVSTLRMSATTGKDVTIAADLGLVTYVLVGGGG